MDILPPASALDAAIGHAADLHPAVAGAPTALRGSRRAAVTATASAMAAARDADGSDRERADVMAPQLVDEAAMSLELHHERTSAVVLDGEGGPRLDDLARRVADIPLVSDLGLDDGDTLARIEDAISRTVQIRARAIARAGIGDRDVVRAILRTAMAAAVQRGTRMDDMDDAELVQLVDDALDDALVEGGHAA